MIMQISKKEKEDKYFELYKIPEKVEIRCPSRRNILKQLMPNIIKKSDFKRCKRLLDSDIFNQIFSKVLSQMNFGVNELYFDISR